MPTCVVDYSRRACVLIGLPPRAWASGMRVRYRGSRQAPVCWPRFGGCGDTSSPALWKGIAWSKIRGCLRLSMCLLGSQMGKSYVLGVEAALLNINPPPLHLGGSRWGSQDGLEHSCQKPVSPPLLRNWAGLQRLPLFCLFCSLGFVVEGVICVG